MPSDTRCNQVFALFEQIQLLRSPAVLPHKQTHLLTWAAAALTSFPERLPSPPLARADPERPGARPTLSWITRSPELLPCTSASSVIDSSGDGVWGSGRKLGTLPLTWPRACPTTAQL